MSSIALGPDADGRELSIGVRDEIVLELPEVPTSGCRWDVARCEGPLECVGDDYQRGAERPDAIGGANVRVLSFRTTGAGRAELRLRRWQPWEGESSVDATFSCTLLIG